MVGGAGPSAVATVRTLSWASIHPLWTDSLTDPIHLTIVILVVAGLFFTFVSAVGVLRLPDVYARAHTASQTDTLGAGLALAAVALYLGWQNATIYTVLLLFFVFITNPTAAHAIARSAAESGVEPWTTDDGEDESQSPTVEGSSRGEEA